MSRPGGPHRMVGWAGPIPDGAYQKLYLVEFQVGDGASFRTRAVRLNKTALVLFSQLRSSVNAPGRVVGCFGERRFGPVGVRSAVWVRRPAVRTGDAARRPAGSPRRVRRPARGSGEGSDRKSVV